MDNPPEARALAELLEYGVASQLFPSAAAWVAVDSEPRALVLAGQARADTIWDLASLTKPLAVVSLAIGGIAAGWLRLSERVDGGPTVRELLGHRAGLPAWEDLTEVADPRAHIARQMAAARGGPQPAVYSDPGYIALGWHLERAAGAPLDQLVRRLGDVGGFGVPQRLRHLAAPTGLCPKRGRQLVGEVHDANAWALGGVCGHAGMFATIQQVGGWALQLFRVAAGRPSRRYAKELVDRFWSRAEFDDDSSWALGWDTPTPGGSSAGKHVSPTAVGHLGFTGTSVWIDRARGLVVVLMTNRVVFGDRTAQRIKRFRPRFHDEVFEVYGRAGA